MSYSLTILNPKTGFPIECSDEAYNDHHHNITYNLSTMLDKLGIYPYDLVGKKVKDCLDKLNVAYLTLLKEPNKYKKYEADNGWGTIDGTLNFLHNVIDDWTQYPEAVIGNEDDLSYGKDLLKWCSKQGHNNYYEVLQKEYFNDVKANNETLKNKEELFFLIGGSRVLNFNNKNSDHDFFVIVKDDVQDIINNKLFSKEYESKNAHFKVYDFRQLCHLIKKCNFNLLPSLITMPLTYIEYNNYQYNEDMAPTKMILNEFFNQAENFVQANPKYFIKSVMGSLKSLQKKINKIEKIDIDLSKRVTLIASSVILTNQLMTTNSLFDLKMKKYHKQLMDLRKNTNKEELVSVLNKCDEYLKSINVDNLNKNNDIIKLIDNTCSTILFDTLKEYNKNINYK